MLSVGSYLFTDMDSNFTANGNVKICLPEIQLLCVFNHEVFGEAVSYGQKYVGLGALEIWFPDLTLPLVL